MNVLWAIVVLSVSSYGISKSAQFLVTSINTASKRFRISDFTLGFFILGIATSTPEMFVGINSVIDGYPQLSLGNLIGAIIVLLSLLIGLSALLFGKVNFKGTFTDTDFIMTAFLLIAPALLLFDGNITRFEGLFLIILYGALFFVTNKKETLLEHIRDSVTARPIQSTKLFLKAGIGVIGLLIFSKIIVETALTFTSLLGVSPLLIGLLMLSIGTNLPELTLGFFVRTDHKEIAIGDFLGSASANVLLIGVLALFSPFQVEYVGKMRMSLIILVIVVLVFNILVFRKKTLTRKDGVILLLIYFGFVAFELINGH